MSLSVDVVSALLIVALLASALIAYRVAGGGTAARVDREQGLVLVGRGPMHAVYRALGPIGRLLVRLGVSANAVTLFSVVAAGLAAVAFGMGHFGIGALIACVAALADAVDGLVARESGTASPLGKVLDTTVDRYVDALLLGGVAVYVRANVALLVLVLAAVVASFMVSYASAIERELHLDDLGSKIPVRRAHRLAYVLVAATIAPFFGAYAAAPVLVAVGVIAVFGNLSSVQRLLRAGRAATAPASGPRLTIEAAASAPPDSGARPVAQAAHVSAPVAHG